MLSSQLAKAEKDLRSPKAFGRAAELAGNFLAGFQKKMAGIFAWHEITSWLEPIYLKGFLVR